MEKHAVMMQRHRDIIGLTAILIHENGNKYEVQASVTNVKSDDIKAQSVIFHDKQSLKATIMINDLKDMKAPVKGYKAIVYKRVEYTIVDPSIVGGFDDAIILYGVVYGK